MRQSASIFAFLLFAVPLCAQDLEKMGKKDMLKVGGGLHYSSVLYTAQGIENRREPFTWFLNGNLTGNIAGISLPYTFNYSNNKITYTQPYNINCLNPSYKWAKGTFGVTSMNLSPYTMAGHIVSGGGLELAPGSLRFSALYGKFRKSAEYDFQNNSDMNMSYQRMGYGASLGYEKGGQSLRFIYFTAEDDAHSLSFVPVNTAITPMKNVAVSALGRTAFLKVFNAEAEYALSGLTRNTISSPELSPVKNRMPLLMNVNATSRFFTAIRGSLGFRYKVFGIQLNYERVDPEYRTLGAYYFNNDLENFTLAPSFSLLGGKLNVSANTGLQRNNLAGDRLNTTKRWVGAINLSYSPNKSWNLNGSYSNFSSFTKQKIQTDPFYRNTLDTLNYYQLAQSASGSVMYRFDRKELRQNILLNGAYQMSSQAQGSFASVGFMGAGMERAMPSEVINGNLSYNLQFTESKSGLGFIANVNRSLFGNSDLLYVGPGIQFSQSLAGDKVRLSAGSNYNTQLNRGKKTSDILSQRMALSYTLKFRNTAAGRMGFSLSAIYLTRLSNAAGLPGFSEFTGNFGVNYGF